MVGATGFGQHGDLRSSGADDAVVACGGRAGDRSDGFAASTAEEQRRKFLPRLRIRFACDTAALPGMRQGSFKLIGRSTGQVHNVDVETPFSISVPGGVPRDAQCMGCGYALFGNESGRCPECGREFDPLDRKTFDRGNSERADRLVRQMLFWRNVTACIWCMAVVAGLVKWTPGEIGLAVITLMAGAVTLYFQTRSANLMLGRVEAVRYLAMAIFLISIWLLGLILIPTLVGIEVRDRIRRVG